MIYAFTLPVTGLIIITVTWEQSTFVIIRIHSMREHHLFGRIDFIDAVGFRLCLSQSWQQKPDKDGENGRDHQ
jgi:hypothetical protein